MEVEEIAPPSLRGPERGSSLTAVCEDLLLDPSELEEMNEADRRETKKAMIITCNELE